MILFILFNATFSYIMATRFSGGRSRREPPTMGKQLVNYHMRLRVECTLFYMPVSRRAVLCD
jgi:hypothetical protein